VTLFGERAGAPLAAVLPPGRAGIVARPPLDPPREERYRRASEAREGEDAAALGALAGELAAERPPEDFTHPFHWAAFRLDGDWR
jgi:hypothetical protein